MVTAEPRSKKFKIPGEEVDEDRISSLPDFVLASILSFLPRTEDAIKMVILSKRWKLPWTQLPKLKFHYSDNRALDRDLDDFANYVERTLVLRRPGSDISALVIKLHPHSIGELGHRLSLWIRFASSFHLEKLTLYFLNDDSDFCSDSDDGLSSYSLPQFLYHNDSLRELRLRFCDFRSNNNNGRISWKSMRAVEIWYSRITDETFGNMLMGSPALVSLKLYQCEGIHGLYISSPSLKILSLFDIRSSFMGRSYKPLVISCSNIECLEILGSWWRKFELRWMSSLISANLDFKSWGSSIGRRSDYYEESRNRVVELLKMLRHVEQLRIGNWCIEVLSELEPKAVPPPTLYCICLVLKVPGCIKKADLFGISSLLCNLPKLEKLVVDLTSRSGSLFENFDGYYPKVQSKASRKNCLLTKLKTVEILGLRPSAKNEKEFNFGLLKFLLANALVLEKMIIKRHGYNTSEVVKMKEKLESFPRSSPGAVVVIPT